MCGRIKKVFMYLASKKTSSRENFVSYDLDNKYEKTVVSNKIISRSFFHRQKTFVQVLHDLKCK